MMLPLLLLACGEPLAPDAGSIDSAAADAGPADSGAADAGAPPAPDAGAPRSCTPAAATWDVATAEWSHAFGWRGVATPGDDRAGILWAAAWVDGELVVGGSFAFAGPIRTPNVAAWSPTGGWRALGDGLPDVVRVLAASTDAIYAATDGASSIYRFRDGAWSVIGVADGRVDAMVIDVDGALVVGGFSVRSVDGGIVNSLASYRAGSGWTAVDHAPGLRVTALHREGDSLCVGGSNAALECRDGPGLPFRSYVPAIEPGRGVQWVTALTRDAMGRPVAAGNFRLVGDPAQTVSVALLDASAWSTLPPPLGAGSDGPSVSALTRAADGSLWVAGDFESLGEWGTGTSYALGIARFLRGRWQEAGAFQEGRIYPRVQALVTGGADIYAAGSFRQVLDVNGSSARGVARFTGERWGALIDPADPAHGPGPITALSAGQGCGTFIAGRGMTTPGDEWTGAVAQLDADDAPVDMGVRRSYFLAGTVMSVAIGPDGTVYAGGFIELGDRVTLLARFVDGGWEAFGPFSGSWFELSGQYVAALAFDTAGVLYVGGSFVARDDPALSGLVRVRPARDEWRTVGDRTPEAIYVITPWNDGVCVAGALGAGSGAQVACWEGGAWADLGPAFDGAWVGALAEHEGDLVAGGSGLTADSAVVRWNGSSWEAVGRLALAAPGEGVLALASVGGSLVAGGYFSLGPNVAYLDGVAWRPLAGGLDGAVNAIVPTERGLLFGGEFELADGAPSWGLARLEPR